ncbi:unnamed protein product [marine sediment metagenome]|uniref:Uncharacterized protein n=1 Tax=marine sediment metagenome TaxID=412755 RepID=X1HXK5_9ZZZZ
MPYSKLYVLTGMCLYRYEVAPIILNSATILSEHFLVITLGNEQKSDMRGTIGKDITDTIQSLESAN